MHLFAGTLENGVMAACIWFHGMDVKHARDVRVNATYWYWIAGVWVPLYAVLYWGPRFL
jgi:heme/copper-type cytochrome/quinol oxidase subunit 3